jgi:AcrR family transcriptional regulator
LVDTATDGVTRPKGKYHHGGLREALIDAAVLGIREGGVQGLSLNELARRVGVSSGAPYRHFADREELLAALAERGYRALIAEATRPYPPAADAGTRLFLICIRYVRFASENVELFNTMFQGRLADAPDNVGLGSFVPFTAAVHDAMDAGMLARDDPRMLPVTVWTVLHGVTVIHITGGYKAIGVPLPSERLIRAVFATTFPNLRTGWTDAELAVRA